jgi:hypothetical protein
MENLSLNRRATESRSFIVTLAVLNAKTDSFQTSSFLQPCDAGDYTTANNARISRVKESYPGVHSIEAKDADEMKTFIQRSVPGSDKMKLIIFHAGLLPHRDLIQRSQLKAFLLRQEQRLQHDLLHHLNLL